MPNLIWDGAGTREGRKREVALLLPSHDHIMNTAVEGLGSPSLIGSCGQGRSVKLHYVIRRTAQQAPSAAEPLRPSSVCPRGRVVGSGSRASLERKCWCKYLKQVGALLSPTMALLISQPGAILTSWAYMGSTYSPHLSSLSERTTDSYIYGGTVKRVYP